jgi:hypothetical protein
LAGLFALLAACQTRPEIRTQAAPGVDLASYHTYGFVEKPSTDTAGYKTLTTKSLEKAVSREMQARGYALSTHPDLLVNFKAASKDKVEGETGPGVGVGVGYGGFGRGRYGWGVGVGNVYSDIRTVSEGSVTIDVVDRERNELVWSGTAVGRLTKKVLDNPGPAIDAAVTDIFARYPRKLTAAIQPAPSRSR